MTNYELQILLWYACEPDDHPHMAENPDEWRRAITTLTIQHGLIEPLKGDRSYSLTERGEVFVDALSNVGLPFQRWVMT